MKQQLINFYLDYVNNYLTIKKMSDDYNLAESETEILIKIGKRLHEEQFKTEENS